MMESLEGEQPHASNSYVDVGTRSRGTLFIVLGCLTLASWNFYLTAIGFFELWFPNRNWAFTASCVYQGTNVIGTAAMVKFGQKLPFGVTYVISLSMQVIMVAILPMLAFFSGTSDGDVVYPSSWGFNCALAACAVIGLSESVFSSLIFGLAGALGDDKLMGGLMTGQGVVGVLCPILMLGLKFISGDPMKWKYEVVFGFFGCCIGLQILGLGLVRRVPRMLVKHGSVVQIVNKSSSFILTNDSNANSSRPLVLTDAESNAVTHSTPRIVREIVVDAVPQLVNIFVIFVMTFTVFPGVAASWTPQLEFFRSKGPLGKDWYTTAIMGIFQVFDVIGRSSTGVLVKWGMTPGRVWIPTWVRIVFLPIFILLHRCPDMFPSPSQDFVEFVMMALFALSNGWCSTLAMMYGPQQVQDVSEQHTVGIVMELALIIGIFAGSLLALVTTIGL